MDSFSGLESFVRAADLLSFAKAGRLLGISASAVGKNVARLEQQLGLRLFNRTTRHVRLTQEGAMFHERCRRILDELDDARAMMQDAVTAPRGQLRVSLPTIGYRFLLPILPAFKARYPEVELDLDFNDRLVDVIAEGVDVAIRSGELGDSQLVARRLGPFCCVLVASPDYLARHGVPQVPADLAQHSCLRYKFVTGGKGLGPAGPAHAAAARPLVQQHGSHARRGRGRPRRGLHARLPCARFALPRRTAARDGHPPVAQGAVFSAVVLEPAAVAEGAGLRRLRERAHVQGRLATGSLTSRDGASARGALSLSSGFTGSLAMRLSASAACSG